MIANGRAWGQTGWGPGVLAYACVYTSGTSAGRGQADSSHILCLIRGSNQFGSDSGGDIQQDPRGLQLWGSVELNYGM